MAITTLPYGKHAGKDIEDIPSSYLSWFVQQEFTHLGFNKEVKAAEAELAYRTKHNAHFED